MSSASRRRLPRALGDQVLGAAAQLAKSIVSFPRSISAASGSQEIHSHDPAKLKAVVHFADLNVESIQAVIADGEINGSHEYVLVAANASKSA